MVKIERLRIMLELKCWAVGQLIALEIDALSCSKYLYIYLSLCLSLKVSSNKKMRKCCMISILTFQYYQIHYYHLILRIAQYSFSLLRVGSNLFSLYSNPYKMTTRLSGLKAIALLVYTWCHAERYRYLNRARTFLILWLQVTL